MELYTQEKSRLKKFLAPTFTVCVFLLALLTAWSGFMKRQPPPALPVLAPLAGPDEISHPEAVPGFIKKDRLVVLTKNTPTTYYETPKGPAGFEYEMISRFARSLNVPLELKVKNSIPKILEAMKSGQADMAAAAITPSKKQQEQFLVGPAYLKLQQQLVFRRGSFMPRKVRDLKGRDLVVPSGSGFEETLVELKKRHPWLAWRSIPEKSSEQLLEMVWKKQADYTVADSNVVAIHRRYYPELAVAFPISSPQLAAWVIHSGEEDLQELAISWMERFAESGGLGALTDKYYGHVSLCDYVDIAQFHRRIKSRLPQLKPLFQAAARQHGLDWKLLAAMAYQESHWDNEAESHTGVKGVMMLTQDTATQLGVANREDPRQSIMGGARYLTDLEKRIPATVKNPNDRLHMALAAYNVGLGHIYDARRIARQQGKNPDSWRDLQKTLPLLSEEKYYKDLPYGYARGNEPVLYVLRVKNFWDILEKNPNSSG